MAEGRYVTAAGLRGLTRFYDSIVSVTMRERLFRGRLTEQVLADLPAGARIADVGAGTGTLAIGLAAAAPAATVLAIDGDPEALALAEARRVLRPGGRIHIADWGKPRDPLMRAGLFALAIFDGFDGIRDHVAGRLPSFVEGAGFGAVIRHDRLRTAWGSLELLSATRSG